MSIAQIRTRGLTASQLKLFAVVTMFIDHLTFTFLERTYDVSSGIVTAYTTDTLWMLDRIGRSIGRQAFPIFAFFIVEGFYHTRSRARYLARLSLFAVISQVPFHLMCYTGPVGSRRTVGINVYATLALGLLAIWIVDAVFLRHVRHNNVMSRTDRRICVPKLVLRAFLAVAAVAAISWFAYAINTDYDYIGVLAIVLFYLLRDNRRVAIMAVWVWMTCGSSLEIFAIAGLLLLLLYNGQRGGRTNPTSAGSGQTGSAGSTEAADAGSTEAGSTRPAVAGSAVSKYAFYVFYPMHMLVLYALRLLIVGY